jgi:hypothetical protein
MYLTKFGGNKMNLRKKSIGLFSLLISSVLLAACFPTPTPPPAPTVDVNALYTQAAVTMIAQLTQNAPTITPTVPPTNTPVPTIAPLGLIPTLPGLLPTLPPLATSTTIASATGDKAAYVTQSPADNTSVKTNQTFNIIWRLRNTGTTTWNNQYVYRFYSASNKLNTAANGYNLTQTVAPNGEVELKVVATAPSSPGTYDTNWVITNPQGVNFSLFTLTINVVQGSSSSGEAAATVTGVPNACDAIQYGAGDQGMAAGDTKTYHLSGGQVAVAWTYNATVDSTTSLTFTYVNDVDAGDHQANTIGAKSATSIVLGSADKDPHTLTVTMAGPGAVNLGTIKSVAANNACW